MIPDWLSIVAIAALVVALCSACAILFDILRGRKQHMWIMNVVWPITALWSGPLGLWAYARFGRSSTSQHPTNSPQKPFWQVVAVAATHCGAGCTLGDIVAEWVHFAYPFAIAGDAIFGAWTIDFVLAFLFGIAFQYFTIVPMRHLAFREGLIQALKADCLSLTAWQVGMYGWMAIMRFAVFGTGIPATSPVFWFLMQIGMAAGFLTSYPVNWWLVRAGIKEKM